MPRDYESMSLEGLVAEAVSLAGGEHRCDLLGHKWVFIGGRHCGCHDAAACSFPAHQCEACGDCDYGHNEEAKEVRARCREMSDDIFNLLVEEEAEEEGPSDECLQCGELLVDEDGEPRACACVRDAEAEHRWEMEDGR